jgi:ribose transport system permease protein
MRLQAISFFRRVFKSGSVMLAIILYLLMFGIYVAYEPSSLSVFGLTNLLNNTVVLALAAAGLTFVIISAEFDLSSVGVIAITNVLVATVSTSIPGGAFTALLLCCAIGLAVGFINGWLVARVGLQSLACTLGTMIMCQGVALLMLAAPGGDVAPFIMDRLTDVVWGAIPVSALIIAAICLVWLYIKRTRIGVALYAVGSDIDAARLSGLNAARTKLFAFCIAGLFYGLAGYMLSAQIGTGDPRVSSSFLLFVFASVAIGGTALTGGIGGVIGSVVGAGILTVMQKMLFALGVAEFYTNIFNGAVMIVAVVLGNVPQLVQRYLKSIAEPVGNAHVRNR